MLMQTEFRGKKAKIIAPSSANCGSIGTIIDIKTYNQKVLVSFEKIGGHVCHWYSFNSIKLIDKTDDLVVNKSEQKSVFIVFSSGTGAEEFKNSDVSYDCEPVIYNVYSLEHGIKCVNNSIKNNKYDIYYPGSIWYNGCVYKVAIKSTLILEE